MGIGNIIGGVLGVGSALIGASGARSAGKAQASAADAAAQVQRDMFEQTREDLTPFRKTGENALAALAFELGLGVRPKFTKPFGASKDVAYRGFEATPGYAFQRAEGTRAIENSAASRGALGSGATLKDLTRFGTGIAAQEYNNFLDRITGVAGGGQNAATQTGVAGSSAAGNIGNALLAGGAGRASGYLGQAAAFQGGIRDIAGFAGRAFG